MNDTQPKHNLILASGSTIRAAILRNHGIKFDIIPSNIDEHPFPPLDALARAKAKALAISQKYPNHWVIGADQICHLNGSVFHKPKTIENAIKTLKQLEGKSHQLLTAAALAHNKIIVWTGIDNVTLLMKSLTTNDIIDYIKKDEPLHSCGAYCFEKNGHSLFSNIHKSKESIEGLPLTQLLTALKEYNLIN